MLITIFLVHALVMIYAEKQVVQKTESFATFSAEATAEYSTAILSSGYSLTLEMK
jgi:uncharacterized protein YhjY with autotransporter beta-barrel domain